jgi:NTE family protein
VTKALVLSGGGPVGIAWQTGLAAGLGRHGVDLSKADLVVGTSAGSAVGAQIALGRDMEGALARYEDARPRPTGASVGAGSAASTGGGSAGGAAPGTGPGGAMAKLMELMAKAAAADGDPEQMRAEIGRFALEAETGPEERFVDAFRYLAGEIWPAHYRCTAVDALTGEFKVWDGRQGETLERAVASSCAVPGVFPPITINGRRYIDGGMRSGTNTDLAEGFERVLVVTLMSGNRMPVTDPRMERYRARAEAEQAVVTAAGGQVRAVGPDDNAAEVMGINLMDPSVSPAAAHAGSLQGEALAGELADWWS